MKLVYDIETDGLLDEVTRIWCLVTMDLETKEIRAYSDCDYDLPALSEGLETLAQAEEVIGHNIISYDGPVINKLYPSLCLCPKQIDTLVLSRLTYFHIGDTDHRLVKLGKLPKKLLGKHSLKAWGYRLRYWKGDYDDWTQYSTEMLEYCKRDVKLTEKIYNKCMTQEPTQKSVDIEMDFQHIIAQQERNGIPFNTAKAEEMSANLLGDKEDLVRQIRDIVPTHILYKEFTPKRDNKTKGYIAGITITKEKVVPFNPGSRQQIISFLQRKYAWEPTKFTDKDNPTIDSDVLNDIPYPEAKLFAKYFEVNKLLGMMSEGKNGWLKFVKDGRIHGKVITIGTLTHRCAHVRPNLGQVPSIGSYMGREVRALFHAPPGYKLVGCDASKLELVCLAHYLAKHDGGTYAEIVESGDVHEKNRQAAGLETRSQAKRFIYAFLYGAGAEKLGSIIEPMADSRKRKALGISAKNKLYREIPALQRLSEDVQRVFRVRGYIKLLDGRTVFPRSSHTVLNTLLQGAGAVVTKKATTLFWERIRAENIEAYPALHCHDEHQTLTLAENAERVGELGVAGMEEASAYFNLRCKLTGEAKIGQNWQETH